MILFEIQDSARVTVPISFSLYFLNSCLPLAIRRMGEGNSFSLFTFREGGVPDPALDGGGGPRSQIFGGGSQVSDFWGGVPVSVKGKIFDTRFGLIHGQTGGKKFLSRDPPP